MSSDWDPGPKREVDHRIVAAMRDLHKADLAHTGHIEAPQLLLPCLFRFGPGIEAEVQAEYAGREELALEGWLHPVRTWLDADLAGVNPET